MCPAARTCVAVAALYILPLHVAHAQPSQGVSSTTTIEIPFQSHDGHAMLGKLTMPASGGRYPVVIYAQTAEGMTVDMKRRLSDSATFNYFDLYATKLPEMNVAFFRYEGRGIRNERRRVSPISALLRYRQRRPREQSGVRG